MFVASIIFAIGAIITSAAPSFAVFLIGRGVAGIGGAGIIALALILILQLASNKRRGLLLGLVNSGFTIGVSIGAVFGGALLPVIGWVSRRGESI